MTESRVLKELRLKLRQYFSTLQLSLDLRMLVVSPLVCTEDLENGSKDFLPMCNKDETNHYLSLGSGPVFWKNLDTELWMIF